MVDTIFGRCSIERGEDGSFSSFNHDLYSKIRRIRGDKDYFNSAENGFIRDSEFAPTFGTGKKYVKDGKTYYIQSAHKHWLRGYYIMLLSYNIMDNGHFSHATIWKENINSKNEDVIESVKEHQYLDLMESSLQEKIDVIISNRTKLGLATIIHINRFDAENIETIDVSTPGINDIIRKHLKSKEPLLISGGMSWVEMEYTNFKMDVIDIKYLEKDLYSYMDIIYFHRNFEK